MTTAVAMPERPKLIFHSNAPFSSTGYGQQCGLFVPLINQHYDVTVSSFYGLNGARLRYGDVTILPGWEGDYGNQALLQHAERIFEGDPKGGLVATLMDVWVLSSQMMQQMNVACWVPVDHEPAPPMVRRFFAESGAIPIAMSRFGERMLAEFDPLYCPHGVDVSVYKPINRADARNVTQIPSDRFVVGMVAANKGNPSRKAFEENLLAFAAFHSRHPDALLYLHTELSGKVDGVDLPALIDSVGLDRGAVVFADQYRIQFNPFPPNIMAAIYSSMDVLLAASCGEGFGIPVLEAQACGTPVIVTDFSAQSELCGAGWKVGYRPKYTVQSSWQAYPDVGEIVAALEKAYEQGDGAKRRRSEKAVKFAADYEVGHVLERYMLPALAAAEERLMDRPVELTPEMAA